MALWGAHSVLVLGRVRSRVGCQDKVVKNVRCAIWTGKREKCISLSLGVSIYDICKIGRYISPLQHAKNHLILLPLGATPTTDVVYGGSLSLSFFTYSKRSPFWRRSKMQRQKKKGKKRGDRARSNARLACHKTAVSIRAKKRISREQNVAFSVLHVSVSMHNLYMWFWDMREN